MEPTVHPLVHLVECNRNGLKSLLTHHINATVDYQFDLLKNTILRMITTGHIDPLYEDTENEFTPFTEITLPTIYQSNTDHDDSSSILHYSNDYLATHEQNILPADVHENALVPSHSPLNATQVNSNNEQCLLICLNATDQTVITREQTTPPCSSLVSTITITEPSRKSTRQTRQNGKSAQPVIELDHNRKLTNIPSTSGLRSSGRKRISRKVLADGQSNCKVKSDKRKSMTQSSKAVKKVKQQKEAKTQVVTLKVNCTEPGCKTILNSHELWKQHLSTVHGQMPYKQLEDNARHNQHGQAEYPCTECEAVYKSQNLLNLHWSKYHLPGKFQCSTCKFVGNFWRKVHNHYRKKHFSRKCQCTHEGCNQTFKFEHNLVNHQRIHSGEKPYRCTIVE